MPKNTEMTDGDVLLILAGAILGLFIGGALVNHVAKKDPKEYCRLTSTHGTKQNVYSDNDEFEECMERLRNER